MLKMNPNLTSYYNDRAKEYDKVYLRPEEQGDLSAATAIFQKIFANRKVLEIACGTGYWTEQISKTAAFVFATDINKSMLDIAMHRVNRPHVTFEIADMYNLRSDTRFDGVFGGFIWSHILLQDLDQFLDKLSHLVIAGGDMVFIDSNQVEGTNHAKKRTTRTDQNGNTFQTRLLDNGTPYEVLKNFPTKDFLIQKLAAIATDIEFIPLEHYWIVSCKTKFHQ
jgi:ubiquinone/menaquinone biosynthesis C-methylase UbiE